MTLSAAVLLLTIMDAGASSLVQPLHPSNEVGAAVASLGLSDGALALGALLRAVPAEFPARGQFPLTRMCFARPWQLPEIAGFAARTAAAPGTPMRRVARFASAALGVPTQSDEGHGSMKVADPQMAIFALDFLLNQPTLTLNEALANCDPVSIQPARVIIALDAALSTASRSAPRAEELAGTLTAAARLDRSALLAIAAHFDVELVMSGDWSAFEPEELREDLQGAVEGKVLSMQKIDELGWVVIGSMEDNRYDMTRIAAVFDPGGNDRYTWSGAVSGSRIVVDMAGNDTYLATGVGGPAGALLGVSAVIDISGNDTYSGNTLALGAAAFGVGILLDRAGNDTYTSERWSVGSALAGVGALVDLDGVDLYDSPVLSQGVGGPCGVGLLLDIAGSDRYRADRTQPSAYGDPATFLAFSQGCAFGYRANAGSGFGACGGIGALVDLAGNDRYECGEFGQGCGYYLGLGLLHDAQGNDVYQGSRYSQGAAAHQAFGSLEDCAGNDTYVGATAANQGGAWDMSGAVLLDRAGDDTYSGGSLSQGAGAQQAMGMLIDRAGSDRYFAGAASQGEADGNQYHWETTHCPSFGLLWDTGGVNAFSSGRKSGQVLKTGTDVAPEGSNGRTQWGLFISR
jgi:hypothetical protein